MSGQECEACGLAACDLPDGVEPEYIFEKYEGCGLWLCQGCASLTYPELVSTYDLEVSHE
jgi:hypothetical protein